MPCSIFRIATFLGCDIFVSFRSASFLPSVSPGEFFYWLKFVLSELRYFAAF